MLECKHTITTMIQGRHSLPSAVCNVRWTISSSRAHAQSISRFGRQKNGPSLAMHREGWRAHSHALELRSVDITAGGACVAIIVISEVVAALEKLL